MGASVGKPFAICRLRDCAGWRPGRTRRAKAKPIFHGRDSYCRTTYRHNLLDASFHAVITPVNLAHQDRREAEFSGDKIQSTYALMAPEHHIYELLQNEMTSIVGVSITRLVLA